MAGRKRSPAPRRPSSSYGAAFGKHETTKDSAHSLAGVSNRVLERYGSAVYEAVDREDLVDDLARDRRLGGDRHRRDAADLLVLLVALAAHVHRHDVHAVLAEHVAHPADHARHVLVAEERDVRVELDVEALAPGLEQVRPVAAAEYRADDAHAVLAAADAHADQVGEVEGVGGVRLGHRDAALVGERPGVDEVDLVLGLAGEDAVQDAQRQQVGLLLRDVAAVLDLDLV